MLAILHILVILLCSYLLAIVCDGYFSTSLEVISKKLKISSEVTGATFMAIGSSAPELFTSIFALFFVFGGGSHESLGAGTIVGSAVFNVLVITGVSLIFTKSTKKVYRQPLIRDLVFYACTIAYLLVFFLDGKILFSEVLVMVLFYAVYVFVVSQRSKWLTYNVDVIDAAEITPIEIEKVAEVPHPINKIINTLFSFLIPNPEKHYWLSFLASVVVIAILSYLMVGSAVSFANIIGVPSVIIGLTILAIGTSIPDVLSSIFVAKKGKTDMAVSNGLGSNIFNILVGLGLVYFIYFLVHRDIQFITVDTHNLVGNVLVLFMTVVIVISVFIFNKWKPSKISGWFLIILYILYLGYNIYLALN